MVRVPSTLQCLTSKNLCICIIDEVKKARVNFSQIFVMEQDERVIWRCVIWSLLDANVTKDDIKALYGSSLARQTLDRYIDDYDNNWKLNGIPYDSARSGRPQKLSPRKKRKVVEELKGGASTEALLSLMRYHM